MESRELTCPKAFKIPLPQLPFKGAGRLASSGMGIEGFGKSKADGLKVMESESHTLLWTIFSRSEFAYDIIWVHVRTHTHTGILYIQLAPARHRAWVCLAHFWPSGTPVSTHFLVIFISSSPLHLSPFPTTNPQACPSQPSWLRGAVGECVAGFRDEGERKAEMNWVSNGGKTMRDLEMPGCQPGHTLLALIQESAR